MNELKCLRRLRTCLEISLRLVKLLLRLGPSHSLGRLGRLLLKQLLWRLERLRLEGLDWSL